MTTHNVDTLRQAARQCLVSLTWEHLVAFGIVYLSLQRYLRFRRERAIIRRYRTSTANIASSNDSKAANAAVRRSNDVGRQGLDLSKMSINQASEIQRELVYLEFPYTFGHSLELAFIQTLAFPYPAKILNDTRQISRPETLPKRLTDTNVLMQNIYNFPPNSPRFQLAISRINYIHSRYSRIQNPDMLYTLCVFACNPWSYIDATEWRQLSVVEVAALGTFWKNVGECLKIDMGGIKGMAITQPVISPHDKDKAQYSSSDKEDGWRDGYDFMLDLRAYMRWHESEYAEWSEDVDALVSTTLAVVTKYIPTRGLKKIATDMVVSEFHEKWHRAMGLPPPNTWTHLFFQHFITLRRLLLRHLALPRPSFWAPIQTSVDPDPKTGRYHQVAYDTYPYYVRPSLWNRYGPGTWASWIFGMPLPGDEGGKYRPEGYLVQEIGPEQMEGKGKEWMERDREWCLERMGQSTCPFAAMMKR